MVPHFQRQKLQREIGKLTEKRFHGLFPLYFMKQIKDLLLIPSVNLALGSCSLDL